MISINIEKAKQIGHDIRRELRSKEFLPLDEQISKQIPGIDAKIIESKRQTIRDKYALIQIKIDSSKSPDQIKSALGL